ncbi:11822_t:CDS:2, partial [Ambispora leptoticha]
MTTQESERSTLRVPYFKNNKAWNLIDFLHWSIVRISDFGKKEEEHQSLELLETCNNKSAKDSGKEKNEAKFDTDSSDTLSDDSNEKNLDESEMEEVPTILYFLSTKSSIPPETIDPSSGNLSHTSEETGLERKFENLNIKNAHKEPVNEQYPENVSKSPDLKGFVEKLGLDDEYFLKDKDKLKKFYDFVGPNFVWPSTMNIHDHREVFSYVVDPDWEVGEEIATNAIAYRRLLESKNPDASKGTHILLAHGEIVRYGEEISSDEYEKLAEEYPGMFYVPIVSREPIVIRRFSAINDTTRKEWQVHIRLQNPDRSDQVSMTNNENSFRMVIDTGSTSTVIPFFLRQKLRNSRKSWSLNGNSISGYGAGVRIYQ